MYIVEMGSLSLVLFLCFTHTDTDTDEQREKKYEKQQQHRTLHEVLAAAVAATCVQWILAFFAIWFRFIFLH